MLKRVFCAKTCDRELLILTVEVCAYKCVFDDGAVLLTEGTMCKLFHGYLFCMEVRVLVFFLFF